ncbi:MAG: iron complex outermembrane receptor protein [Colwellia sp.]|jgi:iron complex outermembrane receptor protein
MSTKTFKKGVLASSIAMILAGVSSQAIAVEVAASEINKDEVEVIQVTGIRGSIKANLNAKRYANAIVDSVSAEDIGKFPDKNVADTLARIPGVTVNRDFGEGEGVTIRGFSPSQNVTLLNGQAVGTAQWFILNQTGRNFNFELLASEMVGSVEVYKSPQADIEEGGLGGTVIVHTRRPLDMDGNTIAGSIEGQYSEVPEKWDPSGSLLYNWNNDDETFGVVVAASLQNRTVERHSQESDFGWFGPGISRIEPGLSAPSTDGVGNPGPEKGSTPWGVGSAVFKQKRERTGFDITAQYRPNADLDIALHYLTSELKADNANSNLIGIPFRGLFVGADNAREGSVEDGYVTELNYTGNAEQPGWAPFLAYDNIYRDGSRAQTQVLDLDIDYQINDETQLHLQFGTTKGESNINDFFTEFYAGANDERVGISFTNPNPSSHGPAIDFTGANPWLTNPGDEFPLVSIFDQKQTTEDKETYLQGDLTIDVDWGAIESVKFGAKIKDREFNQYRIRDDIGGAASFGDASDFWSGAMLNPSHSGNSLTAQSYFDPDESLLRDYFGTLTDCTTSPEGACKNVDQVQHLANFVIEETITNLYAMANFSGDGFRGNIGLRYARTDSDTSGFDVAGNPLAFENDYDELLPSINLAYDVVPDVILRMSAAKVLSRPSPFSLAPAFNLTPETGRGSAGNPDLLPVKANQYDIGLEWYFDEASLVSLTWFKKDISDFIFNNTVADVIDGVSYNQISRPENGGNTDYQGLEFQISHNFDNGFGAFFNYTYVDAAPGQIQAAVLIDDGVNDPSAALVSRDVEFPDVSKTAYNVGGFYENEDFTARVAYTWRDDYFVALTEFGPQFRNDSGSLDAQVSYNVTENITLKVEAVNLTNEIFSNYLIQDGDVANAPQNGSRAVSSEAENGRRFYVGMNFKF